MIWLPTTLTGDRAELTMPTPAENAAWSHIAADSESCNAETCQAFQKGQCFLYRARRAAEAAHIVVANHALMLSDIAAEKHDHSRVQAPDRRRGAPPGRGRHVAVGLRDGPGVDSGACSRG